MIILAFADYHLAESETLRTPACLDADTGVMRRMLEDGNVHGSISSLTDDHSRNFLGDHKNIRLHFKVLKNQSF